MSQPGAHVFHQVTHTPAFAGMIAGALVGAAIAAAVVATGGLALAVAVGAGAVAGGFLGNMLGSMFTIKTGPIMPPCALTVRYENMPAAKVGDLVMCSGIPFTPIPHPASMIAQGSITVFVENMPAARQDDMTVCGAAIAEGCSTVFIGGATTTAFPISSGFPSLAELSNAAMVALLGVISTVEDIAGKIADTAVNVGESIANAVSDGANSLLTATKSLINDVSKKTIEGIEYVYQKSTRWHFEGRSAKNSLPLPPSYEKAVSSESNWVLLPESQSIYYDNGIGNKELKFIHPDGREVVFDGDTHNIVTDPKYIGTYNYVNPAPFPNTLSPSEIGAFAAYGVGHIIMDVIPYWIGGNIRGSD